MPVAPTIDTRALRQQLLKCPKTRRANGSTVYWFDQPFHLYLEPQQAQLYVDMIKAEAFATQLHGPAERLIDHYKAEILKDMHGPVEFYDLGPGLPTKTIPLLKQLQKKHVQFKYFPVDISQSFLDLASQEIARLGVASTPLRCLFEDLPNVLEPESKAWRIFFIGLTFNNYRPQQILPLLKRMAGRKGTCLILTEYYTRKKLESILVPYRDQYAESFNALSLRLVGLPLESLKYFTRFQSKRIEMGFTLLRDIEMEGSLLKKGSQIITALSYRYTRQALTEVIARYFPYHTHYELTKDESVSLVAFRLHSTPH